MTVNEEHRAKLARILIEVEKSRGNWNEQCHQDEMRCEKNLDIDNKKFIIETGVLVGDLASLVEEASRQIDWYNGMIVERVQCELDDQKDNVISISKGE